MKDKINQLKEAINTRVLSTREDLEAFRIEFLSKKGSIPDLFADFKNVPHEHRKEIGQLINELKTRAQDIINDAREKLESGRQASTEDIDLTRPGNEFQLGSRHPISIVRNKIIDIFARIGYTISEGPEIEDDWHNFSALNFPPDHPARDMQDTFFIEMNPEILLRTHTSTVQVRVMENTKPPIRTISPGRVFRNEAISARSHCIFHQVEGLYVDKGVSFADLKQTLYYFAKELLGEDTQIRFRPSFFPFTEPSAEMDVSCNICNGEGCNVCKYTGWLEILGCGMVDPQVLDDCGIDSKKYTGFAFGMGIERVAMMLYQIRDIRLYFENDLRFLKQFDGII